MWSIYEKKSLLRKIRRIPKVVLEHYEIWKRIVEHESPAGLKKVKGFHDEALRGEWRGFRSSRLNKQWRVIYTTQKQVCEVYVIDINPHQYKRG
jgi:addiction module RelE/StbE family toxin